jgi:hypothetical protein
MEKFKVTPTNISTGTKAPYYVIELPANQNNRSLAISLAKEKSNLSNSELFKFDCVKLNKKNS